MEEKPVRKTTAKKAVRRVATKKVPARSVERKPAASSVVSSPASPARKAPARVPLQAPKKNTKNIKVVLVGLFLFSILVGVSALIGFSDKGELDVAGKIADRKTSATTSAEKASLDDVSSATTQQKPTASLLVGMGSDGTQVPAQPKAPATSTQPTATSSPISGATTTASAASQTAPIATTTTQ